MKNFQPLAVALLAALASPALARDIGPVDQAPPVELDDIEPGDVEQPEAGNVQGRVVVQGDGPGVVVRINGEEVQLDGQGGVFDLELPNVIREVAPAPEQIEATFLGVVTEPMTTKAAQAAGLKQPTGLQVSFVKEDSPAAQAGLKTGDVLLKLNDQILINNEQLVVLIRSFEAGEKVTLQGQRQGEQMQVEATLGNAMVAPVGPGGAALDQQGWRVQRNIPLDALRLRGEMLDQQKQDMQQLLQRLELNMEDLKAGANRGGAMQSRTMKNDGQHSITLETGANGRRLTIKNKADEVLYDGLLPAENVEQHLIEDNGLPVEVFNKVKPMLDGNIMKFDLNIDGKPQPAPKDAPAPRA